MKKNKKIKKPYIISTLILLAGIALAQENQAVSYTTISETTGTTQYVGSARVTINTTTPTDVQAKWAITKIVTPSAGNFTVKTAYGAGVGDNALFSTAWSNRVTATYK